HQRDVLLVCHTATPLVVTRSHCCRPTAGFREGVRAAGPGSLGPTSSSTHLTRPVDRQVVRRDDVALLREGTQVDLSSPSEEQGDHSTASLADEMIGGAGLGL